AVSPSRDRASNVIWATACRSISPRSSVSDQPFTIAALSRRSRPVSARPAGNQPRIRPSRCRCNPLLLLSDTLISARPSSILISSLDASRLAYRRSIAGAPAAGVLARNADAGAVVGAGAVPVLCEPPGRTSAGARRRPRMASRQRLWAAARLLAGRAGVSPDRRLGSRRLCAVASLHRDHLLGRVRARLPDRRPDPCGAGRAADGGNLGVRSAVAGLRACRAGNAAHGAGAAVLLARRR